MRPEFRMKLACDAIIERRPEQAREALGGMADTTLRELDSYLANLEALIIEELLLRATPKPTYEVRV